MMLDRIPLDELRSTEALVSYQKSVRARLAELHADYAGLPFPDEQRAEFADLVTEDKAIDKRVAEFRTRDQVLERMADSPDTSAPAVAVDEVLRSQSRDRVADIYDLGTIRASDPEARVTEMRSRALKAVEAASFPQAESRSKAQERVANLLEVDDEHGTIARRILLTGGAIYQRSFYKWLLGKPLDLAEQRALSLTGSGGGYAVPFDLDPTIIPTSNGSVNPLRQISRIVTTTADTWRGVSSGAITAAYAAEATETTDNAPTLAQPEISTEKAQAFIPFSIEIGMDWPGLRAEMGRLLQDAKDDLEATKFTVGTGTNEPTGVVVGATNTVNAGAGGTFTLANLYSLVGALPPRYRPRASFMGNLAILNLIRQMETTAGSIAGVWQEGLQADTPGRLLGKPAYENSAMVAVTTSTNKFLLYGDFSRFVIVDRIGLDIELIPHLFGSNQRPTGQRGLYAYWRNSSEVVDANAFRILLGQA